MAPELEVESHRNTEDCATNNKNSEKIDNHETNDADLTEVVYTVPTKMDGKKEKCEINLKPENEVKRSDPVFLYLAAFTADLIIFACGAAFSWSSPIFPKFEDPDQNPFDHEVTTTQKSWIAALVPLGAAVGPLAAGLLADKIGKKWTLILLVMPILEAYTILAFAHTVTMYYFARFLLGLGLGSVFAVLPGYLAEITEDHNRGKFGCIMGVFVVLGVLYSFLVGPFLSIQTFCLSCTLPALIFLIFFTLFVPDSPHYLASIGNTAGAEEALQLLRNKSHAAIQKELLELLENSKKDTGDSGGIFSSPALRKGFMVSSGLVMLQQFAGINAVLAFLETIFEATGSSIPPNVSSVLIGVVQVIVNILVSAVVEKLGRKTLLLGSTIGCSASLFLLGLFFFMKKHGFNVDFIFWLPIVCLMVYVVAFNFGLGPLPWAVMGEMFPSNVKSVASALTTSFCFLASFGVTLGFPIVNEFLGMSESLWMFGAFCILGVVFIYAVVPETKGRSIEEIQDILSGRKK